MSLPEAALHAVEGQRCLVIEPLYQTPAVETGLEVAEILARKNTVTYLGPDRLGCTNDDLYRFTGRMLIRLSRKRRVSSYVAGGVEAMPRATLRRHLKGINPAQLEGFLDDHASDLASAHYERFDVGQSLRSSLISLTRDTATAIDPRDDFTRRLALDALRLYELTRVLIRELGLDLVVLFNGRLAPVRAIRRACEATDTRYWVHERGATLDKFALYDQATPHLPAKYRGWVDTWWDLADDGVATAEAFLARRRRGAPTNWFVFTRSQEPGAIPERDGRRRVVFFTSSEDEMAAIGDELAPDSPLCVQATAIREVGLACRRAGHELVVRFHPNTPASEERLMRSAHEVADTVCEPQSQVDTYALMDSADVVFTHNSTAGLEAAATGRPTFTTGRNIFEGCTSMRRLLSATEIDDALASTESPDRIDSLRYLNYLADHGIAYRSYEPRGFISGTYRGKDLNAPLSTLRDWRVRWKRGGR